MIFSRKSAINDEARASNLLFFQYRIVAFKAINHQERKSYVFKLTSEEEALKSGR